MTFLDTPKIPLYGKKVLCIDDEIYHEETDRQIFTLKSGLYFEDLLFADSFDSALELLEKYPEISIMIVDIRIPKNSQDYYDYNPENPEEEWGKALLKEVEKRYSNQRKLDIIVVSAYTIYSYSNRDKSSPVLAFLEKPIDYNRLAKNLEIIIERDTIYSYDYSSFDEDTSYFVKSKTREIKRLTKRAKEDIINIGNYLIEVKEKLGHGNFYNWLDAEFDWSYTSAARFMSVASRFKSSTVKDLEIMPSALYELASASVPEEAVNEALAKAKAGETIDKKTAQAIKAKYKAKTKEKKINSIVSSPNTEQAEKISTKFEQTNRPKQKILSVVPSQNAVQNSWWQLGEHHRLFCGEPKNKDFIKSLPKDIALKISFPPGEDFSLIPSVSSIFSFTLHSEYSDLDIDSLIAEAIKTSTKPKEMVLFNYIYYAELLELVEKLQCYFWVAEPDLNKCQEILTIWREKGKVERIIA